jgi:hypothetical protein
MKTTMLALAVTLGIALAPACLAQLQVQNGNGETVTIGPNGINVQSPTGGATNLNITPNGISGVAGGNTHVNISPGGVGTVTTRRASTVRTTTSTGSGRAAVRAGGFSLADQVTQLEIAASGKANPNMALAARVEKLEMDNLGKKGTGSLKERIKALALGLGVPARVSAGGTPGKIFEYDDNVSKDGGGVSTTHVTAQGSGANIHVTTSGSGGRTDNIVVDSNNENVSYSLNGGSVVLDGNSCNVRLTGSCERLVVNGNSNKITADSITQVVLNGSGNSVNWLSTSNPQVVNNGSSNDARPRR